MFFSEEKTVCYFCCSCTIKAINLIIARSNSSRWETLRRLRERRSVGHAEFGRRGLLCPAPPARGAGAETRLLPVHQRTGRPPRRRSGTTKIPHHRKGELTSNNLSVIRQDTSFQKCSFFQNLPFCAIAARKLRQLLPCLSVTA